MNNRTITIIDAALDYARIGWRVFPCHPTGHQPMDGSKDKHGNSGFYLGTTDEKQIRIWWARWPEAAIGLRTGEISGVFAVDIDPRNGGSFSIEHIEAKYGELPETVESQTGGGGRHLFFRWPGKTVKCSTGKIAPGNCDYEAFRQQVKKLSRNRIVRCGHHEPFLAYCYLRGMEQSMIDLLVEPQIADAILGHIFDYKYKLAERMFDIADGKIDLTIVAEDLGSQSSLLMGLEQIRRFILPN